MLRLLSTPLIHTPGIIEWAKCGYATGDAEVMVTMMVDGYHLKPEFARQLLAGDVEYTSEAPDEAGYVHVVIDVDPATATTKYPSVG